jgi:hypothetical protein
VDRYLSGDIRIDEMVTHTMGLEDINEAFDLMHEGKSIRSVIIYWAWVRGEWSCCPASGRTAAG